MPRTRIISQTKAVYVSPTGLLATTHGGVSVPMSGLVPTQLSKVDTFSFDIDLAGSRMDIREFGQLNRVGAVRMSEIGATCSIGYYLNNGENEHNLGLNIRGMTGASVPTSQFISGQLTEDIIKRDRNLYVLTTQDGVDAFDGVTFSGSRGLHDVISFGNASLSSYTANFAVGEIPRADVEFECSNVAFATGRSSGILNPSLNRSLATIADTGRAILLAPNTGDTFASDVLKPGDVSVLFSNNTVANLGGVILSGMHIQSASIEVPLTRTPIERLGNELPFAKPLEFPINVTCSINGLVTDYAQGDIAGILTGCAFGGSTNITIDVKDRCNNANTAMRWILQNAVLDSQNFSIGLDDSETVDLVFSAQIAGALSTTAGLFMSGAYNGIGVIGSDADRPLFISGV
jgi:hypothetical protein